MRANRCDLVKPQFMATAMLLLLGGAAIAGADEAAKELNAPPEGFIALFNGKDFTGWRLNAQGKQVWSIEDGVLTRQVQGLRQR